MLIEQPEARLGSSKVSIHKRAIREVRRINATEVPPASPPLDPKNLLGLGSGGICEGSPPLHSRSILLLGVVLQPLPLAALP